MSFLAVRFIIAGLVMSPYSARRVTKSSLAVGIPIGLVLSASYVTQTFGLQWTTATNSGLITGLFVVFAPMDNRVMFGVRTSWLSWAAIAVSFIGLALLTGSGPDKLNVGDLLTLAGAAFIGVFIALLDRYAKEHDDAGALIQNYAQQHLPAVRVTVIVALTPLSAAVFGFVAAGDRLNGIQIVGAVLMVCAVMLVEVLGNNGKK